jgi:hypothetical protein
MMIARFIAQHRGVLDGSASPDKLAALREGLDGALLLVDEASQISTVQMRTADDRRTAQRRPRRADR